MAKRLQGKVALVTGIGSGIGKACALRFAAEGARVVGCDLATAASEATVAEGRRIGLDIASLHPCDLTQESDVLRFVDHAVELHGRVDVLVNAAAIAPRMASAAEMDYAGAWTPTLVGEVDLVFLAVRAAWPYLVAAGGGAIVNFASVNAFRGSAAMGMVAHCAGKGAVLAMTRQLAVEGGPHNIRANTISPGMVATAMTIQAGVSVEGPVLERMLARMLIKRVGRPEDIADAALFIASDEASWITGADLPVDGGVLAN